MSTIKMNHDGRRVCLTIVAAMALVFITKALEAQDSAERLNPFLHDNVIGLIHLNLEKNRADSETDLMGLEDFVLRALDNLSPGVKTAANEFRKRWLPEFRKAGCKSVFVLVDLDSIRRGPKVLVPLPAGNADSWREKFPDSYVKNNTLVINANESSAPGGRADLQPLIRDFEANEVTLAFVPSKAHRRVIREVLPALPAPFDSIKGPAVAESVQSIVLSRSSSPTRQWKLSIGSENPKQLKALMNRMGESIAKSSIPDALKRVTQIKFSQSSWNDLGYQLTLTSKEQEQVRMAIQRVASAATNAGANVAMQTKARRILVGFHNWADAHSGAFPGSTGAKPGSGLSWRVHLLPYLNQLALYKQFRLDEPWDSPHNLKLATTIPEPYVAAEGWGPADVLDGLHSQGKTLFVMPSGENMLGRPEGWPIREITDGLSNTLAVVSVPVDQAVVWTKPDDSSVDWGRPTTSLFGPKTQTLIAGFADGHIEALPADMGDKALRAVLTAAQGDLVPDR